MTNCCLNLMNNGVLEVKLNYTQIVLSPKCKNPDRITQFRPICLSNFIFKVASKCIANRLKPHMHYLISETQSAFIPGRLITDNVLVAYEINHYLNHKTRGKIGHLTIKLDLSKAFDRV